MIFTILTHNKTISDNNGGTIVLFHHKHALEALGHTVHFLNLDDEIPESDYIIIQSEWYGHCSDRLKKNKAKKIIWLGHFKTSSRYAMLPLDQIHGDYYFTQWQGECVDYAKSILGDIHYLPHGYCPKCNKEGNAIDTLINTPKVLFIGADYPERERDWIDYANVSRITCPFTEAKNYYKSAIVSPNLHGAFQKNVATEYMQIPGTMINDRIFNVIMSGGFTVSDDVPIMREFFNQSEIPVASTKEEYKNFIEYFLKNSYEREPYMQKAKKRIQENYSYVGYYKDFLKKICVS